MPSDDVSQQPGGDAGLDASALVGVVLAGGEGRRFGHDKARLFLEGETLAARAASRLAAVCPRVVVADRGRGVVPGLLSVGDARGDGPAAGLLGAARACPQAHLLVLACDLPNVTPALLRALLVPPWAAAVLPRHALGIEPLCALYSPLALTELDRRVSAGELALHGWLQEATFEVRYLEAEEISILGDPCRLFWNLNRPEDLAALAAFDE